MTRSPSAAGAPATGRDADRGYLEVSGLSKRFKQTIVLQDLALDVGKGEFLSLLGPSGCGKTTLLRLVAGLLRADRGRVVVDGRDITALPAHRRGVSVVFQNYALFPHLTVAENVAFGPRMQRAPRAEVAATVQRFLGMVRLSEYGDRSVSALSGGQQQRVAVARALATRPALLLLDEPFSALDRKLREEMEIELRHLLRELGITAIFVTHDQDEALVMSDRIAVMSAGRIEQFADPATIYARPATPFALDFIGLATKLRGRVVAARAGSVTVDTAIGHVSARGTYAEGSRVLVAVRPEYVELAPVGPSVPNQPTLVLGDVVFLGSRTLLHFRAEPGDRIIAEVSQAPEAGLVPGEKLTVRWPVERTLVYPLE
jgi:putative spermidine/putrescine transport system ATP-binding protein